jgi:hypothetical protein
VLDKVETGRETRAVTENDHRPSVFLTAANTQIKFGKQRSFMALHLRGRFKPSQALPSRDS